MSINEIQNKAAEWLSRQDRGLTASEENGLAAWLKESAMHEVCYLRLQAAWERADILSEPSVEKAAQQPRRKAYFWPAAAIAATTFMGLFFGYEYLHPVVSYSYATPIGKIQSVNLADGTKVKLSSDTVLRTEMSATSRTVVLDKGEAYFEVTPYPKRPFVVLAGSKRITDIGTKFSVRRYDDDVRVVVTEGRVRIETSPGTAAARSAQVDADQVAVTKGAQLSVSTKPENEIANDLSWRSGILVFDGKTLEEAADEFNRYNTKKLIIDGDVGDLRIGGRFRTDSVESFAVLLHKGFGLTLKDRGSAIIVSR
jgi:transmembrane sensor